ncbi:DUF4303 domain-containing protein [Listeria innocua]|uniref:DUF4303 domain-containing protein n=1 Tax=Listeria innocua TaxID=1642 RepID=UPI00162A6FE5|nr:DUF4303 domain-containing protein [Listeria innocua]MBC2133795.1 DUF4303 domain-containing protein [Listeria innocua]
MKIDTQKIVNFAIEGVEKFLQENPELTYYAFAFDCNAEYAEINLCVNTEEAFAEILAYYQSGKYGENYQTEENIQDLKFNTGDWKYQCFDTFYVFSEEELSEIFNKIYPNEVDDDYQAWKAFVNELLDTFTESIIQFSETKTFQKINKTADFKFFCIDHDEELADSMTRMQLFQKK